jgi:hypothetical protein
MDSLFEIAQNNAFLSLVLFIVVAAGVWAFAAWREDQKDKERQRQIAIMQAEAEAFFKGPIESMDVPIILRENESGILHENSTLFETRAYRVTGGGGTRVGGIYVGGAVSESHQRLREIDHGALILTTQRLVFDGGRENRAANLKDILSVSQWADAIEVSHSRRQKSMILTVNNPIIWATLIQRMARSKAA